MNGSFYNRFFFPVMLACYGEKTLSKLKELEDFQWLPNIGIRQWQLEKLRKLFLHANEKIPYYRRMFNDYGLNPKDINTFADIQQYPILDKIAIRDNFKDLLITPPPGRYEKRITSGTTGLALSFIKDRHATSYMRAADYRSLRWHGLDIGMKQARFWSSSLNTTQNYMNRLNDALLRRKRYPVLALSDDICCDYYKDMQRFRPDFVYGYASAIYEFARVLLLKQLPVIPSIKLVITTSEVLFRHQRETIEEAFKCKCVNEYGCTEVGPIAFECEKGNLHLMDDNLYVEFTQNGKHVAPSEPGDILITELHNFSMPFLRYNIGDAGTYTTDPCPCGRGLSVMASIEGRQSIYFQTRDGRLVYDNLFDFFIKGPYIKSFEVLLVKNDKLLINIIPETDHISPKTLDEYSEKVRLVTGKQMEIEYKIVSHIERDPSGKRNYFKSLI